jgi:MFS family permease
MGRVFIAQVALYPSYLLVVSLWGGPYLTHVYGFDLKERGNILLVAALAQVLGSFAWGPADRWFKSYRKPVLIAFIGLLGSLMIFAGFGALPMWLLLVAFALIGFATGAVALVLAHGRSLVPPHLLGRAITLLNMGAMGGGFLVQFLSGAIIEMFASEGGAYPLVAYKLVFGLQAILVLIGLIMYFGSKDRHLAEESALR